MASSGMCRIASGRSYHALARSAMPESRSSMRAASLVACAARSTLVARAGRLRGRARATSGSRRACSRPARSTPSPTSPACRVGHATLDRGRRVRTGVTVVVPHARQRVPGQGAGRGVRRQRVRQAGRLDAGRRARHDRNADRPDQHAERRRRRRRARAVDARRSPATRTCDRSTRWSARPTTAASTTSAACTCGPRTCSTALEAARGGAVEEGSVGAGTGTRAFGWKGGIGTSSRTLDARFGGYTVGVLVQSNYGGVLTMGGAPVGKELGPLRLSADRRGGGRGRTITATGRA